MEFLIPQLPATSNRSSHSNGSILQSALNTLNSRSNGHCHQMQPPSRLPGQLAGGEKSIESISVKLRTKTNVQFLTTQHSVSSSSMVSSTSSTTALGHLQTQSLPSNVLMQSAQMALHSKMTKKQLKLAQAQLDKLTQINIHLHGMFL